MPSTRPFATQLWAYWSMENPIHYHNLSCGSGAPVTKSLTPERLALFNLRIGYQLWSDVVFPYISHCINVCSLLAQSHQSHHVGVVNS